MGEKVKIFSETNKRKKGSIKRKKQETKSYLRIKQKKKKKKKD
jgi:hypothetical protein